MGARVTQAVIADLGPEFADLLVVELEMMDQLHQDDSVPIASHIDQVRKALATVKYDWQTTECLSRELGLSEEEIASILERNLSDYVVRSYDSDYPDRYFYTTRTHYRQIRGPWHALLSLVSGRIR